MKTTRQKLVKLTAVLGHVRVLKRTGTRTVINPYKRRKSSRLLSVVKKLRK
jgi:hypothetical protein